MSEQEEFEFRHRLEQEQAAPAAPPAAAAPMPEPEAAPSFLSKAGSLAKEFFITGHPNSNPDTAPIEPSIGQNLAYPGGVISTAAIQGAKALAGKGSMDDMKQALAGNAKSAPQQLQESGLSPVASYIAGIPLQVATDPMADFSAAPTKAAIPEVAKYIGDRAKSAAENFATTPFFDKLSDATNVVGKGKSIIGKVVDSTKEALPESLQTGADVASGIAGRAAVYKSPLAPIQAVSDAAKGMGYVQKGVAKILDKISPDVAEETPTFSQGAFKNFPPKPGTSLFEPKQANKSQAMQALLNSNIFSAQQLDRISASPYFQHLQTAAMAGGPNSVATTHYVLQQTDPGYQKILFDEQK